MQALARTFGFLMLADGVFDFVFPRAAIRLAREFGCLSPSARRWLAGWEFLTGALLVYLTSRPAAQAVRLGEVTAPERRQAA